MRSWFLGICGLLAVGSGCASSDTNGGGAGGASTTSATVVGATASTGMVNVEAEMLAAHNTARASVDPPAAMPIPPLEWSADLATIASMYAAQCKFEHSDNPDLGENLFASTLSARPADVVKPWVDEKADYNYATNTCASGKECGHYTQVVWAESLRVGCGVAECTENSPFQGAPSPRWFHWVCNYDPPGNYIGQKPY